MCVVSQRPVVGSYDEAFTTKREFSDCEMLSTIIRKRYFLTRYFRKNVISSGSLIETALAHLKLSEIHVMAPQVDI